MAIETPCQTPGAQYDTTISEQNICVWVHFPKGVGSQITEDAAQLLEANIHNALELVLAPYFKG